MTVEAGSMYPFFFDTTLYVIAASALVRYDFTILSECATLITFSIMSCL